MTRLLLVGGGHAHLLALEALARQPLAGAEVMLLTPDEGLFYSGSLPALVAGHCTQAQCRIELAALAAAARVRLVEGEVTALDAGARVVRLADGRSAGYELLSLNVGGVQSRDALPGAREHGIFVRPAEAFARVPQQLVELAERRLLDVVVLGGGAAGFELALALQHRLCGAGDGSGGERARVALVTGGPEVLAGYPPAVKRRAAAALARRRITVFRERAAALQPGAVVLASGARLACDAPIVATGAEPAPWLAASCLALCPQGFVLTGPTLQSRSHPEVFAVGDTATRDDAPHPRSGVQAVRAGPALLANLRRIVAGAPPLPYCPPARTLNLLSCGDRSAIAAWGPVGFGGPVLGRLVWRWKDRIDRAFVARFGAPPAPPR